MEWSGTELNSGETKDIEVLHVVLEINSHPDVFQVVFNGLYIHKQQVSRGGLCALALNLFHTPECFPLFPPFYSPGCI